MKLLKNLLTPGRIVLLVVLALVAAAGWQLVRDTGSTTVTAYFTNADGLYEGDDVKVLGVAVGTITEVDPQGDRVKVELSVDSDQPVPADARAAIISPSLVSGRFVQLSPAWTEGKRMADGDTIGLERTVVPVSFDEVKQQLTDLSTALGPRKGQKSGSLAVALRTIDTNLRQGNGAELRRAIGGLREAAGALSDQRSDLFSTIENLDAFTRNLAVNDAAVRGFTTELSDVSTVLSANRRELTAAVRGLASALGTTETFFAENRGRIREGTKHLNVLAETLAGRSDELAGVLHVAPHALINLHHIIEDQAITGRASLTNFDSAGQLVCSAVLGAGGTAEQCQQALGPLLELLGLSSALASSAGADRPDGGGAPRGPAGGSLLDDLALGGGLSGLGQDGLGALLPGLLGSDGGENR